MHLSRLEHFGWICFFLVLALLPSTMAFGIAPGKTVVDFQPGVVIDRTITLINTEERELHLTLSSRGALASYIVLLEPSITLAAGESKAVAYQLHLPESFPTSGMIGGMLVAREDFSFAQQRDQGIHVGAVPAVATIVQVAVPYAGKTLEASVFVPRTQPFEPVAFMTHVTNVGVQNIGSLTMSLALYNQNGQLITTLFSEERSLEQQQRTTFILSWEPNVLYGAYSAEATFLFDGRKEKLAFDFAVGDSVLEMTDISLEDFVFGLQTTIIMTLQNKGDLPLEVVSDIKLSNEAATYATTLGAQTITLAPQSTDKLYYSWPLTNLPIGRYTGKAIFRIQDLELQRTFHILMTEEGISASFAPLNTLTGMTISLEPTSSNDQSSSSKFILFFILLLVVVLLQVIFFIIFSHRRRKGT